MPGAESRYHPIPARCRARCPRAARPEARQQTKAWRPYWNGWQSRNSRGKPAWGPNPTAVNGSTSQAQFPKAELPVHHLGAIPMQGLTASERLGEADHKAGLTGTPAVTGRRACPLRLAPGCGPRCSTTLSCDTPGGMRRLCSPGFWCNRRSLAARDRRHALRPATLPASNRRRQQES